MWTQNRQPDYRNTVKAARNQRPDWLPFYEHGLSAVPAQALAGGDWAGLIQSRVPADLHEFFRRYCDFCRRVGYDTISFECCVGEILEAGALGGHRPPVITDRASFRAYPWESRAERYWDRAAPRFAALAAQLPAGMKAIGGVGNGAFEIVQDLTGFEALAYLQEDDPELFADLFQKAGELMEQLWREFLRRFGDAYCVCRFGDDLGFKTGPLLAPQSIRDHIIPQYRRVIALVHAAGKPFLLHSCGAIFPVMDDLIAAGIDAKHSNEDAICPYDRWIADYGGRIGLFGGIDMDIINRRTPQQVHVEVAASARRFRRHRGGFAFGSGNQIGHQTPPENLEAMLQALNEVRAEEAAAGPAL